jgi:enediyne biosynthesis protein E4
VDLRLDGGSSGFPAWGDYDNDGKLDLVVAGAGSSANSVTMLFHNEGRGNFSRVTTFPVMGPMESAVEWGDFDNDGDLDLLGGKYSDYFTVADTILFAYRNDGNGIFTRLFLATIGAAPAGLTWGDYDNDGWLDIWFSSYSLPGQRDLAAPDFLFHNNTDGTFTRITEGEIVNTSGFTGAAAWGDYDNDGFLDLSVANGGYRPEGAENFLYHNDGNSNRWLTIKCAGTASNRSSIGAKVRVRANIGGKVLWQLREVSGGNGKNGGGLRAYFGLGDATTVDILRIEWPSGTVQELQNVAVNQLLTIVEPPRLQLMGFQPDGSLQLQLTGAAGFEYDVQTSSDLSSWTPWMSVDNTSRTMLLTDPSAANAPRRFYRAIGP